MQEREREREIVQDRGEGWSPKLNAFLSGTKRIRKIFV